MIRCAASPDALAHEQPDGEQLHNKAFAEWRGRA
jgi:hypothetical protein